MSKRLSILTIVLVLLSCSINKQFSDPDPVPESELSDHIGEHEGADGPGDAPRPEEEPRDLPSFKLQPYAAMNKKHDLVIIPSDPGYIAGVLTACLQKLQHRPAVLVADRGMAIPTYLRQATTLLLDANQPLPEALSPMKGDRVMATDEPLDVSLAIAATVWGECPSVVAMDDECESLVAGTSLATALGLPLIVKDGMDELVRRAAAELGTKEIILVSEKRVQMWPNHWNGVVIKTLTPADAIRDTVRKRGPAFFQTIAAGRSWHGEEPNSSLLLPYYCLIRRGLPALTDSFRAVSLEEQVATLITRYNLSPRSISIFGSNERIATHEMTVYGLSESEDGEEEMDFGLSIDVEPFTLPQKGRALSLAVGRFPFDTASDASLLLANCLQRERAAPKDLLLIANPKTSHSELHMCEAIARQTAAECINRGIGVTEYYREDNENSDIWKRLRHTGFFLYQGHITDQRFFDEQEKEELSGMARLFSVFSDSPPKLDRLEASPVVFMQSCSSLDNELMSRATSLGVSGMIGSATSIHSASGASFAKSVLDGLIHRDALLGEAVRDARNYFFCLVDMKTARKHKQQTKGYRVALSFRLWGDPEMRVWKHGNAEKPPIAAAWKGGDLHLTIPRKRLKRVENEKYIISTAPGASTAGIVKRLKDKTARKLMPLYFTTVECPADWQEGDRLTRVDETSKGVRCVLRISEDRKKLAVLYFPERHEAGRVVLRRSK